MRILKVMPFAALGVWLCVAAAPAQPTSQPTVKMGLNDSRAGTIGHRGDVNTYEFTITAPGIFQFAVRNIPKEIAEGKEIAQLGMTMSGPPGFQPWSKFTTDHARSFKSDPFALAPGTYQIRVKDYFDDIASSENYTIQTMFTEVNDPGEPNDTMATATPLRSGKPAKGYILPATDVDHFKIQLVTPGRVKVKVSDIPPEIREGRGVKALYLGIFDGQGRLLKEFTSRPRQEVLETDEEVMNAGTYYLCVKDFNARNFSASPYALEATFPDRKGELSPAERDLLEALTAAFKKRGGPDADEKALLQRLEARFLED